MSDATGTLRRTALHGEHTVLGGRMVPFAGFDMPVQYAGILAEHRAVRERAGMFDLSHMAQFVLRGADVPSWADRLTVNYVGTMKPLQARYNLFTNERGGTHDDVLFYRLPDRWLLVVNAGNAAKMWEYLSERSRDAGDVHLENRHGAAALIAVQGPRAVEIVSPLCDVDVATLAYYFCIEGRVCGVPAVIARTGYTGEDGFELFVDGADAPAVWRSVLEAGRPHGLEPAGLGARDMLRLEAGMPLYGFELSEDITPVAAGQAWAVKMQKEFVGKAVLEAQARSQNYDRIVGLVLDGRVPARTGYRVLSGDRLVGEVRSASLAPSAGNRYVATALVPHDVAAPGTELQVEVRGARHPARVTEMPFYKRPRGT